MISSGSDNFRSFLASCHQIGFSTAIGEPLSRQANQLVTHDQEQFLRRLLPDFAEFIVPVYWSNDELLGLDRIVDLSVEDYLRAADELMRISSEVESQNLPLVKYSFQAPIRQSGDHAYVDLNLRATAIQPSGFIRQGYLAICRGGLALVGAIPRVLPELSSFQLELAGPERAARKLRMLVPDLNSCEIQVIAYLTFDQIESVTQHELIRFDGYAALHYGFLESFLPPSLWSDRGVASRQEARRAQNMMDEIAATIRSSRESGQLLPENYLMSMMMAEFQGPAIGAYSEAMSRITYGFSEASGTGYGDDGLPGRALLVHARGLVIESSLNGQKVVVESNFADLDVAYETLNSLIGVDGKSMGGPGRGNELSASNPISVSQEILKLKELLDAGVLTDAEFELAKRKFLE